MSKGVLTADGHLALFIGPEFGDRPFVGAGKETDKGITHICFREYDKTLGKVAKKEFSKAVAALVKNAVECGDGTLHWNVLGMSRENSRKTQSVEEYGKTPGTGGGY